MPLVAALSHALPVVVVNSAGKGVLPRQGAVWLRPTAVTLRSCPLWRSGKTGCSPAKGQETEVLTALVTRRRQVIEMLTAEKNRLGISQGSHKDIQKHIDWLQARLGYRCSASQKPCRREKAACLSVPGVGQCYL